MVIDLLCLALSNGPTKAEPALTIMSGRVNETWEWMFSGGNTGANEHENLLDVLHAGREQISTLWSQVKRTGNKKQYLLENTQTDKNTSITHSQKCIILLPDGMLLRVTTKSCQSMCQRQCCDWWADRRGHHGNTKACWWLNAGWDRGRGLRFVPCWFSYGFHASVFRRLISTSARLIFQMLLWHILSLGWVSVTLYNKIP